MSDDFSGVLASLETASSEPETASPAVPTSDRAGADAPLEEVPASAAPPASDDAIAATDPTAGQQVPYRRFKEVNDERTAHKATLDKLAWARDIPETDAPAIRQFYDELKRDPIGTLLREVEAAAHADPAHAQAIRSAAARWMGSGRKAETEPAMPEPDLQSSDGTLVYSAAQAQALMDWRDRRTQAQVARQLQPIQQWTAERQAETVRRDIATQANDWARSTFDTWSKRPHFTEYRQQIGDLMAQHGYGVADAYAEVLTSQVLPKLSATERSSVVAAMHQKAAAGTTNPSRGTAHGPPAATSFGDALRQLTQAG